MNCELIDNNIIIYATNYDEAENLKKFFHKNADKGHSLTLTTTSPTGENRGWRYETNVAISENHKSFDNEDLFSFKISF